MRLADGLGKSCYSVSPWSLENDFLRVVGLNALVEMSAPSGVYLRELSGVDYGVRQYLLFLWFGQEGALSLTSPNTLCVRRYKIDPRAFNQGGDRSHGMTMLGWSECG